MPLGQCEAVKVVLGTTELVEKLLPYLDLETTFNLAQTHKLTREVLQKRSIWRKLIRRGCHYDEEQEFYNHERDFYNYVPPHHTKTAQLKKLIKVLQLFKSPEAHLLDLLELVCERFKTLRRLREFEGPQVLLSHPGHSDPHSVSIACFLLLEEIEGAFGTTLQRLESISGGSIGGLKGEVGELALLALSSRVARQHQGEAISVTLAGMDITNKRSAKAFYILMRARPQFVQPLRSVEVSGSIGVKGWEFLARALQTHPDAVEQITTTKRVLGEGMRADLKKIWDAVGLDGFCVELCCYTKTVWQDVRKWPDGAEDGWKTVEKILQMTEEEWAARAERAGGVDEGAGGEFSEAEDHGEEAPEEDDSEGEDFAKELDG